MFSKKYTKLNNKQYLYNTYVVKKKSLTDIQREVNCKSSNSVRQALIYHSIPVRNVSEGLCISNEKLVLDLDIINGSLLGDGFLSVWNKDSDKSYPVFQKKNKFKTHIQYVAKQLLPNTYKECIKAEVCRCNNKQLTYWRFNTKVQQSLSSLYGLWYPGGVKHIPNDIMPTSKLLLHWFLDDGSTSWRHRKHKHHTKTTVRLTFSSQSFIPEEQEILRDKVNKTFNLHMSLRKTNSGTGYVLAIPETKTNMFFDIIGPPPVPELAYKWKRRPNERETQARL